MVRFMYSFLCCAFSIGISYILTTEREMHAINYYWKHYNYKTGGVL